MNERIVVEKTYKLFIGGAFPRTESGRYRRFDLADGGVANVCRASRKDVRNAVVAARAAAGGWSATTAYLKGQVVYRIAEMLEARTAQFIAERVREGCAPDAAAEEVARAVDRLIHFAGWSDKHVQLSSTVNPVASAHFCFSRPEPVGVVGMTAPASSGLLGLVSLIAPAFVGGNAVVVLAAERHPLSTISFAEVLAASDVPAGSINLLTGEVSEMLPHLAGHMDVNALALGTAEDPVQVAELAAGNLKRLHDLHALDWASGAAEGLAPVAAFQEIKTTWHPVAN